MGCERNLVFKLVAAGQPRTDADPGGLPIFPPDGLPLAEDGRR